MLRLRFLLPLLILTACAPVQNAPSGIPEAGALAELRQEQTELLTRVMTLENRLALLQTRLDEQQRQLETGRPATEKGTRYSQIAEPGSSRSMLTPATATEQGSATPTQIYLQAFSGYAAGRYSEAIDGFRLFLDQYPNNAFAGNAQFWLGECYYKQRMLTRAASEYEKVVAIDAAGAKAPDALLRIATIYRELNQSELAAETLQKLRDTYPDSAAARKSDSL
jgi:tol-pal system protein YbgF